MNPAPHADQVWTAILPEIRATRRRRRTRRLGAGVAAIGVLGCWVALRPAPPSAPAPGVVHAPPPLPAVDHLAVYRVTDDGSLRLEAVGPDELGTTELKLGLTPVVLTDHPADW